MSSENGARPLAEGPLIRYIPVLLTCALCVGVPVACAVSCAGIMYAPVAESLGTPVSQISAYTSMTFLSSCLISIPMGRWLKERDNRYVLSAALLVLCLSLFAMSQANAPWQFWTAGFFMGIGTSTLMGLAPVILVNRWFCVNNGIILGILMAFSGIGGAIFNPIGQAIIDSYGWRYTYLFFAAISLACMPFIVFALRSKPSECGLLPYGWSKREELRGKAEKSASEVPLERGVKTAEFWIMGIILLLVQMCMGVCFFFPSYVGSIQALGVVTLISGAVLSSIAMVGQAVGKIVLGFFGDVSVRTGHALACVAGILGILFCWFGVQTFLLPVGGFVFGLFYAFSMVLTPLMVKYLFGSGEQFPEYWARLKLIGTLGSALSLFVWPFISENFGGYSSEFTLCLVCLVIVLLIGDWCLGRKERLAQIASEGNE